ncbi:MAG: VacJ family lipoprotein [Alphaproteobacteria bacterium]|jgi:phospholipid-binding lipoprotein MlaA
MKVLRPTALVLALLVSACTTPSPESLAANDPWEETNRDVFAFDVWIEHHIAAPVNDGYRAVVPEPAREGLHNVVTNLHAPIVLANDVLQARPKKAVNTLARIVLNTTFGLGGLIDVAGKLGIPYHDNDFGVTLGRSGVAEGSYLVLPLIGPLPPRDLVASGVDGVFDPLSYARFPGRHALQLSRSAVRILDTVDQHRDEFESIERTSVDFYATTRNLYRQNRNAKIRGDEGDGAFVSLPDL